MCREKEFVETFDLSTIYIRDSACFWWQNHIQGIIFRLSTCIIIIIVNCHATNAYKAFIIDCCTITKSTLLLLAEISCYNQIHASKVGLNMKHTLIFFIALALLTTCQCLYPKDSPSRLLKDLDGVWHFKIDDSLSRNRGFDEEWFLKPVSHNNSLFKCVLYL